MVIAALVAMPACAAPRLSVMEVRANEDPARLRLVAYDMPGLGYDDVADQFDAYCARFAGDLAQEGIVPQQIVVSISDRYVRFGDTVPDAAQFFELYDVVDGTCVWRAF